MKTYLRLACFALLLACASSYLCSTELSEMSEKSIIDSLIQNELVILNSASEQWKLWNQLTSEHELLKTVSLGFEIQIENLERQSKALGISLEEATTLQRQSASQATKAYDSWKSCADDLMKEKDNRIWWFLGGMAAGAAIIIGGAYAFS